MKTAYDYTIEFISVLAEIDAKVERKAGISNLEEENRLDKEIDILEGKLFEIRDKLKGMRWIIYR